MNCCSKGCSDPAVALGIPFDIFALSPELYKPNLYSQAQFNDMSSHGRNEYVAKIAAFNKLAKEAEREDLCIDEAEPWLKP